jgi:osmotically-inducible protein OsmY
MLTAAVLLLATSSWAQDVHASQTYNSKSSEVDSVHASTVHNYESSAVRANDALLITEVKTALADDGVTIHRAVVIDCDHGVVSLAGIVGSPDDAEHAGDVARDVPGVVAVKNNLRWP